MNNPFAHLANAQFLPAGGGLFGSPSAAHRAVDVEEQALEAKRTGAAAQAQSRSTLLGTIQKGMAMGQTAQQALAQAFKSGAISDVMAADPDFLGSIEKVTALLTAPAAKAPETRKVRIGNEEVAQEFDPATGGWKEVSRGAAFAPPSVSTTNINMPAPMKDNIWTEHGMKRIGELDTELATSQRVMVDLDAAEAAIDAGAHQEVAGPKIGFQTPLGHFGVDLGTDFLMSMMQVGRALGIVDADRMAETELLDSITSRMAPMMRPVGSGSSSDRDMELFLKAVPGLSKSAAGNKKIIELMRKGILHKQEQMKVMVEMLEDGTYDPSEFSERVAKLGRPFSKDEMETLRIVAQNRPVQLQKVTHLGSGKTAVEAKAITPEAIEKMQAREILMLDVTQLNAAQRAAMVNRMSALGM